MAIKKLNLSHCRQVFEAHLRPPLFNSGPSRYPFLQTGQLLEELLPATTAICWFWNTDAWHAVSTHPFWNYIHNWACNQNKGNVSSSHWLIYLSLQIYLNQWLPLKRSYFRNRALIWRQKWIIQKPVFLFILYMSINSSLPFKSNLINLIGG